MYCYWNEHSEIKTKGAVTIFCYLRDISNNKDGKYKCRDLGKKGKRKVQGVPQSQTADLPRPQEEEETNKSKQAQTEQTYEKH